VRRLITGIIVTDHVSPPHVAIDTKNLALFGRGISAFVTPLIRGWLGRRPDVRFSFVGPPFDTGVFSEYSNWHRHHVPWPKRLPRPLRHPVYDNVLFPYAIWRLKPDFLFSPYHDVRLPRRDRVPSVMIVHDTCIDDLIGIYPSAYRTYYVRTLRRNLTCATHILTDSESSRARIQDRYGVGSESITVVYNSVDQAFVAAAPGADVVAGVRRQYGGARALFYPGGSERRKNIGRLLTALQLLATAGEDCRLLVTGNVTPTWRQELARIDLATRSRVHFTGYLDVQQLRAHYGAADAVVYPTLCEGFGRVCLDAMVVGVPLACSDLPVLREIAGDYPIYFDPLNPSAIAGAVRAALHAGPRLPRLDPRFIGDTSVAQFTALMDAIMLRRHGRD
jgi:glycosyltransferase involved in cell wall biosynthesis